MEKESKFDLELFKEQLILFSQEQFGACDSFAKSVKGADTAKSLKYKIQNWRNEIADKIGVNFDECDRCEDAEDELSDLKREYETLEEEVLQLKGGIKSRINSLDWQYKMSAMYEYSHNYTSFQFENLLKSGNQLLKAI